MYKCDFEISINAILITRDREREIEKSNKHNNRGKSENKERARERERENQHVHVQHLQCNLLAILLQDLSIIYNAGKLNYPEVMVDTSVESFAKAVLDEPFLARICRLKQGSIKKTFKASPAGAMSSEQMTSMSKTLTTSLTEASDKFEEMLQTQPGRTRVTKPVDLLGSTNYLGYDRILLHALEEMKSHNVLADGDVLLLDRDAFVAETFGLTTCLIVHIAYIQ